jgi:hypothetical protein
MTNTQYDFSNLDPDSPLVHMSCDTLEDYELFRQHNIEIRNGYWYHDADPNQHIFSATTKEIAIAKRYNLIHNKPKCRLDLIGE